MRFRHNLWVGAFRQGEFGVVWPCLYVERVATDFELVLSAAKLKAEFPVSYADCFAVATALRYQAAVVTGDPEFKRFERCVAIQWV